MWNLLCMVDGTMHVWWNYMCWISHMFAVNLPCEKYMCIIYLLWKWLGIWKNRGNAGSLPSATDGNGLFAVCRWWQRSHVASSCASWELTHLVSLPTVADGKDFAVSGRRQRTCHVVTCRWHHTADGKDPTNFAVSGGRQRLFVSHLTDWQHNYCRPPSLPSAALSLPSAADGKDFAISSRRQSSCLPKPTLPEPFAVRGWRQRPLPSAVADGKIADSCSEYA